MTRSERRAQQDGAYERLASGLKDLAVRTRREREYTRLAHELMDLARRDRQPIRTVSVFEDAVPISEDETQPLVRVIIWGGVAAGYVDFRDYARVTVRALRLPPGYLCTLEFAELPPASPADLI